MSPDNSNGYGSGGYGNGSYGGIEDTDNGEDDNEDDTPIMADAPQISGSVNEDELNEFIDTRIDEQDSGNDSGVSEERVREILAERDADNIDYNQLEGNINYEQLAANILEQIGSGSNDSPESAVYEDV